MSGRGNGKGKAGRGGRGKGRSGSQSTTTANSKGLCVALGNHMFDYNKKGAADQVKVTWEKIVDYAGTQYGEDVRRTLSTKKHVVIPVPVYTPEVLAKHAIKEAAHKRSLQILLNGQLISEKMLTKLVQVGTDTDAPVKLAKLQNEIQTTKDGLANPLELVLTQQDNQEFANRTKAYSTQIKELKEKNGKVFSLIMGQCTQLLKDQMIHDPEWTKVDSNIDPLDLYTLIEKTVISQSSDCYPCAIAYDHIHKLYTEQIQTSKQTNDQWYSRFNTNIDVGASVGVSHQHKVVLDSEANKLYNKEFDLLDPITEQPAIRVLAEERYLAYVFLQQSGKQHDQLRTDLKNDFSKGQDYYPQNRQEVLHRLGTFSTVHFVSTTPTSEGVAFAQGGGSGGRGGTKSGRGQGNASGRGGRGGRSNSSKVYDKEFWKDKTCFKCNKKGHPSNCCTLSKKAAAGSNEDAMSALTNAVMEQNKSMAHMQTMLDERSAADEAASHGANYFQQGFNMTQVVEFPQSIQQVLLEQNHGNSASKNMKNVILLDSQSTMDLFCNPALVTGVHEAPSKMTVRSNGGQLIVDQQATVTGYNQKVWFSSKAITNIIALHNIIQQYKVTYDSTERMFVVHREKFNKPNMEFKMQANGLHVYEPRNESYTFISTVAGNKEGFSQRQIKGAESARELYSTLGFPSMKDFKWVVQSNQILNCPVTVQDIDIAHKIWGKDIAALKGKTTRSKPIHVARDFVKIPSEIVKLHKEVYLTLDLFFVNKIPFLLTLSRNICFTTVNHLADRKLAHIFQAFLSVYKLYLNRGFRIVTVHADGEFAPLQALIHDMPGGPMVNLASANEHVPEIERRIRVVKERARAHRHSLPFNRIPKLLTIHIVFANVRMLNFFPSKGGISDIYSPRTIMSGETLNFKKHLSLKVGQYCQIHEEDEPRNSQLPRTQGAICLGPSENIQGGFKFMTLSTAKKVVRRKWDVIPMPDTVIARVNTLGSDQPELLVFTDRSGRQIGDIELTGVDGDENEAPQLIEEVFEPDIGDDLEHQPIYQPEEEFVPLYDEEDQEPYAEVPAEDPEQVQEDPRYEDPVVDAVVPDPQELIEEPEPAAPQEIPGVVRRSSRARAQTKTYVPSMKGKAYGYAAAQYENNEILHPDSHMFHQQKVCEQQPDVAQAIMTQLSLRAGLREWGSKAKEAVHSEMKQLHLRGTFKPMHWHELTVTQKKSTLESHMFLKLKRDGKIKGRTVAGGNKQRDFISKEDASSPTVATEAVLLTCIVDAEEGRDVAVVDIPNAFIQTRIEDEKDMAIIKVRGILVDMLEEIDPKTYKPYVTNDKNGTKQLVVQCLNAIYGTMVASLLYYRKFCASLTSIGFEFNPYDPCVANKMINGKQMTIAFHVDDCKISHEDPKEVDKLIQWLRQEYESIFEDGSGKMTVNRGKVHNYLGMTLDYSVPGQVKISMQQYIDEILEAFDKAEPKGKGTKTSAAPETLFKVNEDCPKLKPDKAKMFHNLVAKMLYATKRARPDTCTAIAYLTTRVREPDQDDWSKLVHLMKYIRGTREMPLILSANGSGILKWWVDGSYGVHPNLRGHTGGGLSLGRGFPIVNSTKQKLNTRSSTESEIVGVDDCMPAICWTRYFLQSQGYGVSENIVYQDNMSAILLEKNGKASSGKRTKHINIRYFFVTDRIQKKEMKVEWCPTEDMIGDFMTKPNQGALFSRFRDQIMGVISAQNPSRSAPNVKSECLVTSGSKASGRDHRSVLAKVPNPLVMGPMNPTFQGTTSSI